MLQLATLPLSQQAMLLLLVTAPLTHRLRCPPLSRSGSGSGSPSVHLCSWAHGDMVPPPLPLLLLLLLLLLLMLLLLLLLLLLVLGPLLCLLLQHRLPTSLEGGKLVHPAPRVLQQQQLLRRGEERARE